MLKRDSGTGGTKKMRKVSKPPKKTPPKTAKTIAKKAATPTYTRTAGGKGFKGRTKPTVSTSAVKKEVKKYVPTAKSVKGAVKSIPSTVGKGISDIMPNWPKQAKGKSSGDWGKAENWMDKQWKSPGDAISKVRKKKPKK